ncbi:MAG: zinc dependent phospholipase C family protein [Collinsella sp.]|nr:zinc dependent phospholipase C family protein [Collinsella sp.]
MPALLTHRLFGEQSVDRLPAGIVSTDEERMCFLLGNQGPDPFFFRFKSLSIGDCRELARRMHRSRMSRQLSVLREGVSKINQRDASLGRAFALGLLSHYVLDRNAHPFVYDQQWGIMEADGSLESHGDHVHAVIESDLDVLMLQLACDGMTAAERPPHAELASTPRIDLVAGVLMSHIASRVYGIQISPGEYGGAVADMRFVYKMIEPAGSLVSRSHPLLSGLSHPVTTTPPLRAGNLDRRVWRDPFTGSVSNESFPQIFERALDDYALAAARFVDGVDMVEVTGHVNYSGRPLSPDEEFDREE